MKVTVIGGGYVGLVTAACLADVGNDVVCLDIDEGKVESLRQGIIPIYEPGLEAIVRANHAASRLAFTTDPQAAVGHAKVIFIAVGTPPNEDGSADLAHVLAAARTIGRFAEQSVVVVDKSTVPVGTADKVRSAVAEELASRGVDVQVAVVSNPEFLKEGAAVRDFMHPDRVVIGSDDAEATATMRRLYTPFVRNHDRVIVMSARSAELTKYAANAMLATRISFMNELANLAERVGADIEDVRLGIGSDSRIGYNFLYAGIGYGGSCFPKDVRALSQTAASVGYSLSIVDAVHSANERQKLVLCEKIEQRFGRDLSGRRFAVWGLAFKPETDDVREAPALAIISWLLERGARIAAYDPVAASTTAEALGRRDGLSYADSAMDSLVGADAVLVLTEWKEFRTPDFDRMGAALGSKVIFDGRNLFDTAHLSSLGFEHFAIGRASASVEGFR